MTETRQVMVLEDNAAMRNFLYACVSASGYAAVVTSSAQDAIQRFRAARPDAVILSLAAFRPTRTLRTIAVLHSIDPDVPVIVISGHARASMIAQALNRGASDFVSAPFDETDVELALARAVRQQDSDRALTQRRRERRDTDQGGLVGSGAAMRRVREFIDRAAATDLTVLIRGEGGTGKTLVAREIVAASPRWDRPFVKVNCAARPDDLVDAELLALAAGSVGGAASDLAAKFACAAQGTLFLDEIGQMSASMQGRLLKILQDRESAHLQGTRDADAHVRIIASSSLDLERAVVEGRLREELFFRLNVLSIQLPPLRERRTDIPELVDYFLRAYAAQYRVPGQQLSPSTMHLLCAHDWPGNVRELENVVQRLALLGTEEAVAGELRALRPVAVTAAGGAADPGPAAGGQPAGRSLKEQARLAAREAERTLIRRALDRTHWNRKEAAALLGISYKALLKKIKECDLQNT